MKEVFVGDGERRRRYVVCHNQQEETRQMRHCETLLALFVAELESMRAEHDEHTSIVRACPGDLLVSLCRAIRLAATMAATEIATRIGRLPCTGDSSPPQDVRQQLDEVDETKWETKVKVFISWSGPRSGAVAEALRKWLPDVIQQLEPWLSKSDIEAGARWGIEMSRSLSDTDVGIICLTPAICKEPWILFEAGSLAKKLDDATRVCLYLIEMEPASIPAGPLTQFQAVRATREDTHKLLETLNRAMKDRGLPSDALNRAFARCWPELQTAIMAAPPDPSADVARPEADPMIGEILMIVRSLVAQPPGSDSSSDSPKRTGASPLQDPKPVRPDEPESPLDDTQKVIGPAKMRREE